MTDSELRKQFLFVYGIMRDHLALTAKLESAVDMMLARDTGLKAHYDAAQSEEQGVADQRGDPRPRTAIEMLLQVAAEIRYLSPPQISWERESRP